MANNQYVNKLVVNGVTKLDLSGDTITADKLATGYTAHDASGKPITGTATISKVVISDTPDSHGGTIRTITTSEAVYIGTKSVTPTESSQTVTPNTGYDALSSVTVGAIPSSYVGSGVSRKSSSDLTSSGATVTAPAGYYENDATKTIASGSATINQTLTPTPSISVSSSGLITASINTTVGVKPSVTAGYIESGTLGSVTVRGSNTSQLTTQGATTITPGTTDQTIAAGTYLTGAQTISGDADLVAGNIKKDVQIFGVTGTYEGSGGGGLTLLKTTSLGTLSTSSTSSADTGKTMTVTGYNDYDVLVVDVSVDSPVNGRHTSTVSFIILTGTSTVGTKNTYTVASNKWNSKLSSSGTGSTRQSTSAYGVYANGATVSSGTMTIPFYYRYNSNSTGTLNGTYTARVYGLKLYDLIGG